MSETVEEYEVVSDLVPAQVTIQKEKDEYVPIYDMQRPQTDEATTALLSTVREKLTETVKLSSKEFIDPSELDEVKEKFRERADELLEDELPSVGADDRAIVVGNLLHDMLGLGDIEIVLADANLEEIVVNGAQEPLWVYHKEHGWLKTNISFDSNEQIRNYSATIARRVGKQISSLHPLLDAHLPSGDRTNATIFPISTEGNTITIRKFARSPWTITDFIRNETLNKEIASLLWLAIQYEMNVVISGGTGSGKCLTGGSEVLLADGTTRPIKEIVEETFEENGKEETDDGWYTTTSDINLFSYSDENGVEKRRASKVWKREAPDTMFRIETASGREITATPEHPFFVNESGNIRERRADQLEEQSYIPIPRKISPDAEPVGLNVNDWAEENGFTVEKEYEDAVCVRSLRGKTVALPQTMSDELGEFLGLIAGDGHLHKGEGKGGYRVELHNSNDAVRERFKGLCRELFGIEAVEEHRSNRVDKAVVYSRVLLEYLEDLHDIPSGAKSGTVSAPDTVERGDTPVVGGFLRGLFEVDGSVHRKKGGVELSSASEEMVEGISTLLKRFGIVTRKDEKEISGKRYFRATIGPEALQAFQNHIGFISDRKQGELRRTIDGSANTNVDVVPSGAVLRELKQVARLTDYEIAERAGISRRSVGRYLDGSRTPSRDAAEKLLDAFRQRIEELQRIEQELGTIQNKLESAPSPDAVAGECLTAMQENDIERKSITQDAGIAEGTLWHWENEVSPTPQKVEAVATAVNDEVPGATIEYTAPNFQMRFQELRRYREALQVTPTGLKEETGIDVGVYEAGQNKTTTPERIQALFSYLHSVCTDAVRQTEARLPALENLMDDSIFWDRVKTVEEVDSQEEWVYDLTVPGNHTFVANGVVAHNTSLLNVLTPFIPPNHRIVSIEDTREISLPGFLHWVPLTTREPNPEGKGGVSMLDLLVNSLRMRPDRIIVGEIRRERQAEVLFEAMHTGHSVYSTLHADTAEQTIRRLTNPPINVPETLMEAVDLNVVMFRDRRENIRRAMQISEVVAEHRGGNTELSPNVMYRWRSSDDEIVKQNESKKLFEQLQMHAGLSESDIEESLKTRENVLEWMVEHEVDSVDDVGKVVAEFYENEDRIVDAVKDDEPPENVL